MKKIKKKPLWAKIKEELENEIINGKSGEMFYTIDEICRKYNVSRITSHRVIRELRNEGLLDTSSGRISTVRKIPKNITINVIFPETYSELTLLHPTILKVYTGIMEECNKLNINNLDFLSEQYIKKESIRSGENTGCILFWNVKETTRQFYRDAHIPFVMLHDGEIDDFCVGVDREYGAYIAVKYLISLGHKRIGFITGPVTSPHFLPRHKGYIKALEQKSIEYDSKLIKETPGNNSEDDVRAFEQLMNLSQPPTAIFAANDYRAIHVLEYCVKKNIKIPDEISIMGFDNIKETLHTVPPLTTVETHRKEMGKEAVQMLINLLSGSQEKSPLKNLILKPELVIRQSTMPYKHKSNKK